MSAAASDTIAARFGRALNTLVEGGGSDILLMYAPVKVRDEAVKSIMLPAVLSAGGRDDFASITRSRLLRLRPEYGQLTLRVVAWPEVGSQQLLVWEGVRALPTGRIRALADVLGQEQAEAAVGALEAARSAALPLCLDGLVTAPWLPARLGLAPGGDVENTPPQLDSPPSKRQRPVSEDSEEEEPLPRPAPRHRRPPRPPPHPRARPHPHPHPIPPPTPSSRLP